MAEIMGVEGDVARCPVLPENGSSRGRREAVAVCRSPREVSMYEGRGGAATCCRSSLGNGRDMGDGRGCPEMSERSVEEEKGEYCREMSWSTGE